ncbi:MAG: GNAT family N-acetyltransferase [Patescibacteria group bacterium]|nr:GNAT family N-acetyltransferase [Patescibacteria group bacterium]
MYWEGDFREKLSKKLADFVNHASESVKQEFGYFVAEENGEVVGVAILRKAPAYIRTFASTGNPAELYILAVKNPGCGIGKALAEAVLSEMKSRHYTEAVLYSSEAHRKSWGFYKHTGFERVGPAAAPSGEPGFIWRKVFE